MPSGNPGIPKTPEHNAKVGAAKRAWWAERKAAGWVMPEEQRVAIARGHTNNPNNKFPRPKSLEWRTNQSEKMKGRSNPYSAITAQNHTKTCVDPNCNYIVCRNRRTPISPLEEILLSLLREFPKVLIHKGFGTKTVDLYLPPPYHIAFEADSEYYHQNLDNDKTRDTYLWDNFQLPVIRIREKELLQIKEILDIQDMVIKTDGRKTSWTPERRKQMSEMRKTKRLI